MTIAKSKDGKRVMVPDGMRWDADRQCIVRSNPLKRHEFRKLYKGHLRDRLDKERQKPV